MHSLLEIEKYKHIPYLIHVIANTAKLSILLCILDTTGEDLFYRKRKKAKTVTTIAQELHLSLSTVSHYVRDLQLAGFISCKKRGYYTHCYPP